MLGNAHQILKAPDGRLRAIWRFVLAVLLAYAANYVASGFASVAGDNERAFDLIYRPLSMCLLLGTFSLLLILADKVEINPLSAMGLGVQRPWLRNVGTGLLLGFGMILVAVVTISLFGNMTVNVTLSSTTLRLALVELVILATGAMSEELMFRGYPFQRLVESAGPVVSIAVLSVLFGVMHLWNPGASFWSTVNTVLVGVLFAIAYLRTRSLWMPWGLHFAWNTSLGLIFGLPVSGLTDFSVIAKSRTSGPTWLTGGNYGIEASALGTSVILLGLAVVIFLVPRREPSFGVQNGLPLQAEGESPHGPSTRCIQL